MLRQIDGRTEVTLERFLQGIAIQHFYENQSDGFRVMDT
jgi:hypothetical protein